MIRDQESYQGTWTEEDRVAFVAAGFAAAEAAKEKQ